jgi:hypothetical protein
MSQKSSVPPTRVPAEKLVRDIRRATRKHHSAEDKIRIVLEGLRGEESIAAPFVVAKPSPRACTTPGPRSSWKPVSAAWPVTQPARPPATRSRRCARKPAP